jgi:hypothetical protein
MRLRRFVPWVAAFAAAGTLVAASFWLEREDDLRRCPAIAVLNGDQPARVDTAADIARSGYSDEVWLTNDPRSGTATVPDAGTESNALRLASRGVAPAAIRVLSGAARGTRAELQLIGDQARGRSLACTIIVTSPAHVARVRVLWRTIPEPKPTVVIRHASNPGYAGGGVRARELAFFAAALVGWSR